MTPHGTLIDALEAASRGDKGYTFIERNGHSYLSFQRLKTDANILALALAERGVRAGDRILLILPTSPKFATHYFAIIHLGAVPCVQPSPRAHATLDVGLLHLQHVSDLLGARLVITEPGENARWGSSLSQVEVVDAMDAVYVGPVIDRNTPGAEDTALIQATSGSTAGPKCIALSHANVLYNCAQIAERTKKSKNEVAVGWLPMFHDLGLIGTFLYPLCQGSSAVLMSPTHFMRRPVAWLQAISKYRGTLSPAPNFGFAHIVYRVRKTDLVGIDLSSWRAAPCGGERIDSDTLRDFAKKLAPVGFNRGALMPSYGLAEATVCVTMSFPESATVAESSFFESDPSGADTTSSESIVGCGFPITPTEVSVLDENGDPVVEGVSGHICVSGPTVMQGYLGPDGSVTTRSKNDPLDTGDIGYLRDGQLFVVGRAKEVIIIRGQNRFPTEFESAAAELSVCARMRFVAIGVPCHTNGETLHLIGEHPRAVKADAGDEERLADTVARHVAARTGVLPVQVSFVARKTLPLTTSGKLQRRAFREIYLKQVEHSFKAKTDYETA